MLYSDVNDQIWEDPIPQSRGEYMIELACNYVFEEKKDEDSTQLKPQEIAEGVGTKGRTLEILSSGGYTYALLLLENDKTKWIALPEIKLSVGDRVEFPETPPLTNFESKTLNKFFDEISFVPGLRILK